MTLEMLTQAFITYYITAVIITNHESISSAGQ